MNRYKFFFKDIEKPITIEAPDKFIAKQKLETVCDDPKYYNHGYRIQNIVNETTEELISGVSEKIVQGIKHTWNGMAWQKL